MSATVRTRLIASVFAATTMVGVGACGDDDAGVDIGEETNLDDGVEEDLGEHEGDFEGPGGGDDVTDQRARSGDGRAA